MFGRWALVSEKIKVFQPLTGKKFCYILNINTFKGPTIEIQIQKCHILAPGHDFYSVFFCYILQYFALPYVLWHTSLWFTLYWYCLCWFDDIYYMFCYTMQCYYLYSMDSACRQLYRWSVYSHCYIHSKIVFGMYSLR